MPLAQPSRYGEDDEDLYPATLHEAPCARARDSAPAAQEAADSTTAHREALNLLQFQQTTE
jgi:hypothetical protein